LCAPHEFTATLPRVALQVRQQFLDALALAKHSEGCAASWARLFLGGADQEQGVRGLGSLGVSGQLTG
jgi:hypothetical protein